MLETAPKHLAGQSRLLSEVEVNLAEDDVSDKAQKPKVSPEVAAIRFERVLRQIGMPRRSLQLELSR